MQGGGGGRGRGGQHGGGRGGSGRVMKPQQGGPGAHMPGGGQMGGGMFPTGGPGPGGGMPPIPPDMALGKSSAGEHFQSAIQQPCHPWESAPPCRCVDGNQLVMSNLFANRQAGLWADIHHACCASMLTACAPYYMLDCVVVSFHLLQLFRGFQVEPKVCWLVADTHACFLLVV
jgi:hypothetical protein